MPVVLSTGAAGLVQHRSQLCSNLASQSLPVLPVQRACSLLPHIHAPKASALLKTGCQQAATTRLAAVAGIEKDLQHVREREEERLQLPEVHEAVFNWQKAWYPMMGLDDLDPAVPHAIMLLGKRLVLWRDAQQTWRCLEDSCPHRRVPMSEGRIEPTDGNLQCCYHGWRFDGTGACVAIPALQHAGDERAHQQACSNPQACIPAHPVRVEHNLVWVWGDCSSQAGAESDAAYLPWPESLQNVPDDVVTVKAFNNYSRDLHGAFDVWLENMADQSHVAYAHHGAAGNREGEKAGFFKMEPVRHVSSTPSEGFKFLFDWTSDSKKVMKATNLQFKPPCLTAFTTGGSGVTLWIYAVPTSANTTRILINSVSYQKKDSNKSKGFGMLFKILPRWVTHLTLNAVNDGDLVFMHRQSEWLRQAEAGGHKGQSYFMPSQSDRGVTALRKWINRQGGGGPQYASATQPPHEWFSRVNHRELLDRHQQHTVNCSSCSQALATVQNVRKGMIVAGSAALLTMAALAGHEGLQPSSGLMAAAVTASGAMAAYLVAGKLEAQFVYTDWDNRYH